MPRRDRTPAPPDKQCRATTRGLKVRGAYWSPPKRYGNYAGAGGCCWLHRPPEPASDNGPPKASDW